ncbi:hypothetical protein [Roseovarius salinarum]|uniref:hypothetical protein n=1 Tax=Roseovarius salinarum TaxID=1981892 RepID=UPI0018E44932|nr:hypothetical protein [Roseovarius salinarum]
MIDFTQTLVPAVLVFALLALPAMAFGTDMSTLTPTLTYPEPAPDPAPVTRDSTTPAD